MRGLSNPRHPAAALIAACAMPSSWTEPRLGIDRDEPDCRFWTAWAGLRGCCSVREIGVRERDDLRALCRLSGCRGTAGTKHGAHPGPGIRLRRECLDGSRPTVCHGKPAACSVRSGTTRHNVLQLVPSVPTDRSVGTGDVGGVECRGWGSCRFAEVGLGG